MRGYEGIEDKCKLICCFSVEFHICIMQRLAAEHEELVGVLKASFLFSEWRITGVIDDALEYPRRITRCLMNTLYVVHLPIITRVC